MTSLNATHMMGQTMGQTIGSNRHADDGACDAPYPQSLMLRMMQNASRSMGRGSAPRLDAESLSENLRRDIGFVDWTRRDRET
jgi:hypothetical protein